MIEMTNMKRPISPHLSIYRPQTTSVFSILHRMTGVYIFVFFVLLSLALFMCSRPDGLLSYSAIRDVSFVYYIMVFGVSFFIICLSYHVCAGIRYLFWSLGIGLNIHSAKLSAVSITILTIVMSSTSIYMFLR